MRMLICLLLSIQLNASDLCGGADQKICLQSSINFNLTGVERILPGTAVQLVVPGISSTSSQTVSGDPTVNYRLEVAGTATDNQGGTWDVVSIEEDMKGNTAIAYVLTEGVLTDPLLLEIRDFQVCQYVSDGPAEVTLSAYMYATTNKRASQGVLLQQQNKMAIGFESCATNTGNLPLLEQTYEVYVSNPHDEAVSFNLGDESRRLEPGQRLKLNHNGSADQFRFNSSLPLPTVFASRDGDLNLVGLPTGNHANWMVPHLARDTDSWENQWIFANNERLFMSWLQEGASFAAAYDPGIYAVGVSPNPEDRAWAQVNTTQPFNGFFQFSRRDGVQGAAWVGGVRLPDNNELTQSTLYLPHVAEDTGSFWTGFSIANPHDSLANVTMEAIDESGLVLATEHFDIPANGNEVGTVGGSRFVGVTGVSWIRVSSDQALAGVQLIGAVRGDDPNFSGFLLPSQAATTMSFPAVFADQDLWTGVAVINPEGSATSSQVQWLDVDGNTVRIDDLQMAAGTKELLLAPTGASHALIQGDPLIGFALVGEHAGTRVGGYLGLVNED